MKSSNVGGQAVIEGVMMKHADMYAVAVRKPDNQIEVKKEEYKSIIKAKVLTKIPIIRGGFNFIDSMVLGIRTLTYSASFYEEEEEEEPKASDEWKEKLLMTSTVIVSIFLAVSIFMILPFYISRFFQRFVSSWLAILLIEGVIRIGIFIIYVMLISQMQDIKRVYMYHGAEHKCINCVEHGLPLTVENVKKSSKQHKRCGTSFLLIVMMISILFFMFIRVDNMWLKVSLRILLLPLIAGVSYEFIKLAGRSDNAVVNFLSKPGMWMQNLTTKEPEDDMIEVAIASTEAVFDWKQYLKENFEESIE